MTTDELIAQAVKMTDEERLAFVMAQRPDLFTSAPRTVSFGKAPKDGWKDSDKVQRNGPEGETR